MSIHQSISKTLTLVSLIFSCLLAFLIRLFSIVIHEPIIHEFDPHFNWRCTQYIEKHGIYEFFGWFDNISWYPQGRPVGETAYPGLMFGAATLKFVLQKIHIFVDLQNICVFMGPTFSVFSTLIAFLFGNLIDGPLLGNVCAFFTSFAPGMITRSVGGAFDYECISLFLIVLVIYFFALALECGSILLSIISALAYGYLSFTWGGYVFISNCIPLFVMALITLGRFSPKLYITYSIWAILGTIFTSQIPFIFEKTLSKPEHFAILLVFFFVQVWGLFTFFFKKLSKSSYSTILVTSILAFPLLLFSAFTIAISTGILGHFSGRLIQMFDPSYASKKIPIIASVAEHQPTSWSKFISDSSLLLIFFLLGCYTMLQKLTETKLLLLIYALSTMYFASVMVRLVLVFTPAMVLVSSIGFHSFVSTLMKHKFQIFFVPVGISFTIIILVSYLTSIFFCHYYWSGDHIHNTALSETGRQESDDYREAYRWLFDNTHKNHIVMSWWDYGYQITSMANRGCLADGNTNNFTHIGIIGMTMSSPEPISWRLARMMDVEYMLIIFGGAAQYSGDDINKFLWMPRIANQTFTNISGSMYQRTPNSSPVSTQITTNMSISMMFKFCYYNFNRFTLAPQFGSGYDYIRQLQVPNIDFKLYLFEEAFTSKFWMVRIYRVKKDPNWERIY